MKNILFFWIIALLIFSCKSETRPFKDLQGNTVNNAIAELRRIPLGGAGQWISIRGISRDNPVLLFVNSPGEPSLGLISEYLADLEKKFIVVSWDQRGSGKSYTRQKEVMTLTRSLSDLHELTVYLIKELNQPKIFLLGFSGGTVISIYEAFQHPEYYYAYIAAGQRSNIPLEIDALAQAVLKQVEDARQVEDIERLQKIAFKEKGVLENFKDYQWLTVTLENGETAETGRFIRLFKNSYQDVSEYSWIEKLWMNSRRNEIQAHYFSDFNRSVPQRDIHQLEIPVYFCVGKQNREIPLSITTQYFNELKAPEKKIIEFEFSGNYTIFEEPDAFVKVMSELILPANFPKK